jgi:hypothetical protein
METVGKIVFMSVAVMFLFGGSLLLAQDGSNISYIKPEELRTSDIGRRIQIDFYRRSFGRWKPGNIDKITIEIDGKSIEFVEHREDDGFNNCFSQQYLESIDNKVRITEFKLLGVEKDTITVSGHFNVQPFEKEFTFKKADIAEILMKAVDRN